MKKVLIICLLSISFTAHAADAQQQLITAIIKLNSEIITGLNKNQKESSFFGTVQINSTSGSFEQAFNKALESCKEAVSETICMKQTTVNFAGTISHAVHQISGHNIQSAIITLGKDTKKPFIATVDNGTFGGGSTDHAINQAWLACERSGNSKEECQSAKIEIVDQRYLTSVQ